MTGIWFEDVVDIGPDGQTQEGLVAVYDEREHAEACLPFLKEEFGGRLEFSLVDNPVLVNPTLEKIIESMRWGEV